MDSRNDAGEPGLLEGYRMLVGKIPIARTSFPVDPQGMAERRMLAVMPAQAFQEHSVQARLLFPATRRGQSMVDEQERLSCDLRCNGSDAFVESPLEVVVVAHEDVGPHVHRRGEHQGILQVEARPGEQIQRKLMHAGGEWDHGKIGNRTLGSAPHPLVFAFYEFGKAHGRPIPRQPEESGRTRELSVPAAEYPGDALLQRLVIEQLRPRIRDLPVLLVQRFGVASELVYYADVDGRIRVEAKEGFSDGHFECTGPRSWNRRFVRELPWPIAKPEEGQAGLDRVAGLEPTPLPCIGSALPLSYTRLGNIPNILYAEYASLTSFVKDGLGTPRARYTPGGGEGGA